MAFISIAYKRLFAAQRRLSTTTSFDASRPIHWSVLGLGIATLGTIAYCDDKGLNVSHGEFEIKTSVSSRTLEEVNQKITQVASDVKALQSQLATLGAEVTQAKKDIAETEARSIGVAALALANTEAIFKRLKVWFNGFSLMMSLSRLT
jgi:uncharacterized coiled-coil protein SlyX